MLQINNRNMNSINFIDKIANNDHPYVIAEIGINHNGDIKLAMEMIDAASDSKADCVKFQSFFVDKYISSLAIKIGIPNLLFLNAIAAFKLFSSSPSAKTTFF